MMLACVDLRTVFEQCFNDLDLPDSGCRVKWRFVSEPRNIRIGAGLQQRLGRQGGSIFARD